MSTERLILRLVDMLYSCAEGSTGWPVFLDLLARAAGASITSLTIHSADRPASSVMSYTGIDEGEFSEYTTHYARLNPWFSQGIGSFPEGQIISTDQVLSPQAFRRTIFYNEWGRRNHVTHALGGAIVVHDNTMCFLAVNRGDVHPAFSRKEKEMLERLMPHLRRAVDMHNRLGVLEEQQWILDALAFPLIHVASNGAILWANREGDRFLRKGRGLIARSGKLHAEFPEQDARLHAMLAAERQSNSRSLDGWGGWLRIDRSDGQRELSLYVVRPPSTMGHLLESPGSARGFLIFVATQSVATPSLERRLREVWGLTPAESSLAIELLESDSLNVACARLRISRNTAKTQLAAIFAKADVRRQSELMRRLLALAVLGEPSRASAGV